MSDRPELYIGLISGTSMDGIDAALVDLADADRPRLLDGFCHPFPEALRQDLSQAVARPRELGAVDCARLDMRLGETFADAALDTLDRSGLKPAAIRAIGSHGQTLYHDADGIPPVTIQIGNPALVAERTGIDVVGDFRSRDLAAGGHAAPLATALHAALFRSAERETGVLNIGGIANLTVLPRDAKEPVTGFDTGPGNCLMDDWIRRQRGEAFDADGAWAAQGTVLPELLQRLRDDPYFQRRGPKSTGRETYNPDWLIPQLGGDERPRDVQATLLELTVSTIADALARCEPPLERLLVCGGGARNGELMKRLAAAAAPCEVADTAEAGLHADWVEATLFAWLAQRHLRRLPGNLPEVTGAEHPVILGALYPA